MVTKKYLFLLSLLILGNCQARWELTKTGLGCLSGLTGIGALCSGWVSRIVADKTDKLALQILAPVLGVISLSGLWRFLKRHKADRLYNDIVLLQSDINNKYRGVIDEGDIQKKIQFLVDRDGLNWSVQNLLQEVDGLLERLQHLCAQVSGHSEFEQNVLSMQAHHKDLKKLRKFIEVNSAYLAQVWLSNQIAHIHRELDIFKTIYESGIDEFDKFFNLVSKHGSRDACLERLNKLIDLIKFLGEKPLKVEDSIATGLASVSSQLSMLAQVKKLLEDPVHFNAYEAFQEISERYRPVEIPSWKRVAQKRYETETYPVLGFIIQLEQDINLLKGCDFHSNCGTCSHVAQNILILQNRLIQLEDVIKKTKIYQSAKESKRRDEEQRRQEEEVRRLHYEVEESNRRIRDLQWHNYWHSAPSYQPIVVHHSPIKSKPTPQVIVNVQSSASVPQPSICESAASSVSDSAAASTPQTSTESPAKKPGFFGRVKQAFSKKTGADYDEFMDTTNQFFSAPFGA